MLKAVVQKIQKERTTHPVEPKSLLGPPRQFTQNSWRPAFRRCPTILSQGSNVPHRDPARVGEDGSYRHGSSRRSGESHSLQSFLNHCQDRLATCRHELSELKDRVQVLDNHDHSDDRRLRQCEEFKDRQRHRLEQLNGRVESLAVKIQKALDDQRQWTMTLVDRVKSLERRLESSNLVPAPTSGQSAYPLGYPAYLPGQPAPQVPRGAPMEPSTDDLRQMMNHMWRLFQPQQRDQGRT
uniref:Uncharacterized protein n=1 Tax=Hyaloperonospora arabidopsidis (strain Emoy2) TaxID=559515 RepID=M4BR05_HYAAE